MGEGAGDQGQGPWLIGWGLGFRVQGRKRERDMGSDRGQRYPGSTTSLLRNPGGHVVLACLENGE